MRVLSGGLTLPVILGTAWAAAQTVDPGVADAVRRLETAAKAGDADKFAAEFAEPVGPQIRGFLAAAAKADAAGKRLIAAADAKFGPGAGRNDPLFVGPHARFIESLKRTQGIAVEKCEADGTNFKLTVKVFEREDRAGAARTRVENWSAVKNGESWKLLPKDADKAAESMKKQVAGAAKLPDLLDRTAAEIAAGKYKTREDAAAALSRAVSSALGTDRE